MFLCDRLDRWQIEGRAANMRMFLGDFDAKQASRSSQIAESLEARKIEFPGQGLKIYPRETRHRAHELFEPWQLGVKLLEHCLLAVLGFILQKSGVQGLRQVMPELEKAVVQHRQPTADVAGTGRVEIKSPRWSVEVFSRRTIALSIEKLHCHECVEEIANTARVQAELGA